MEKLLLSPVRVSGDFFSTWRPSEKLVAEIAATQPQNPFLTESYFEARCQLGYRPAGLGIRRGGRLTTGSIAFAWFGRIYRACEIPSTPLAPKDSPFWQGLLHFCRSEHMASLRINTYASPRMDIPHLPGETERQGRVEFIYNLQTSEGPKYSSNHLRNIHRGRRFGLNLRVADDEQACRDHTRLMACSRQRRRDRNESFFSSVILEELLAFVRSRAGKIFQTRKDRQPLSSALILLAPRGAYYHSAGSTPEGMRMGSAHFLVHETAQYLREEGLELFNLGGAEPSNPGLERFKSEFGTLLNPVPSVVILPDGPSVRLLRMVSNLFHRCVQIGPGSTPGTDASP